MNFPRRSYLTLASLVFGPLTMMGGLIFLEFQFYWSISKSWHEELKTIDARLIKDHMDIKDQIMKNYIGLQRSQEVQDQILRKQEEIFALIQGRKLDGLMTKNKSHLSTEMGFDWDSR